MNTTDTVDQQNFLKRLKTENWGPLDLEEMISEGYNVHALDEYGMTFPHWAIRHLKQPVTILWCITLFIKHGFNPNTPNSDGRTLLHLTVVCEMPGLVEFLIEQGLSVNAQDNSGCTPLFDAVFYSRYEDTCTLIKHGADPNVKDMYGDTPASISVRCANPDIIKIVDPQHFEIKSF